jgi:hypothetical protein
MSKCLKREMYFTAQKKNCERLITAVRAQRRRAIILFGG